MLDDFLEFIIDIFLELIIAFCPTIPRKVKIFLTCTLLIALFGTSGLLVGVGIVNGIDWQIGLGAVALGLGVAWFLYLIYRYGREKRMLGEC